MNGEWVFDCNKCSFTSREDSEAEALQAADNHADYGPGHFDFEIRRKETTVYGEKSDGGSR